MQPESKGIAVTEMLGEIWRIVTGQTKVGTGVSLHISNVLYIII